MERKITANSDPRGALLGTDLKEFIEKRHDVENIQEYIKALGFIIKENQCKNPNIVQVGRSFYARSHGHTVINPHLFTWNGFFKSFRPTQQGLALNVDVSTCAFFEETNVLQYVIRKLKEFDKYFECYPQSDLSPLHK